MEMIKEMPGCGQEAPNCERISALLLIASFAQRILLYQTSRVFWGL